MEAQGPLADPDGELRVTGPFRISRHPNNATALGGFLQPRMTVNRATLATLSCAYAVVGSLHEERRLRRRHGEAYDRYRAAVPFLLGPPRSATGARGRRAR
jgi:protein-S-isoprenylcysteine O-methyltransferase Ste14